MDAISRLMRVKRWAFAVASAMMTGVTNIIMGVVAMFMVFCVFIPPTALLFWGGIFGGYGFVLYLLVVACFVIIKAISWVAKKSVEVHRELA